MACSGVALLATVILVATSIISAENIVIQPGQVKSVPLNLTQSSTTFTTNGPSANVFICATAAFGGSLNFTGRVQGGNGANIIVLSKLEPSLNTTCLMVDTIPAGASFVGELSLPDPNETAPLFPFVIVNVEEAVSTKTGMTQTWGSPAGGSRYAEGRLGLLRRKWFYLDQGDSIPLMSFETCDPPASPEIPSNETTMADSQWLPRLTILPPMREDTKQWNPDIFTMSGCAWELDYRFTTDFENPRGLSVPACPTAAISPSNASAVVSGRTYFYVVASPIKSTAPMWNATIQQLNATANTTGTQTTVGFYLALRWDDVEVTSQSLAPLRINNDLIISFEGPQGMQWPVNASDVFVYGAMRPIDTFMNSTRDRELLYYMVNSGCFLRQNGPLFNATEAIVTTDESNRRVNVQLPLFYAFNNKPDTKITPPFYGYVGVLLKDPRFVFVRFRGATLPSNAFPGQGVLSQLAQVLIASLGGIVLVLVVITIALGVQLKKANQKNADYQAVAETE